MTCITKFLLLRFTIMTARNIKTPQTCDELREKLIHGIYALINNESDWQETLSLLNQLIKKSGNIKDCTEIASLLPHINNINLLHSKVSKLERHNQQNTTILDHMPMGIILFKRDLSISRINTKAQLLLIDMQATYQEGLFKFFHSEHQKLFQKSMNDTLLSHQDGVPFRIGKVNLWFSKYDNGEHEQITLYLTLSSVGEMLCINTLRSIYDLTEKEAIITCELCNGKSSLNDAAQATGIAISTARSHLKQVFIKTNTTKQAELVKLILTNPALMATQDHTMLQAKDSIQPLQLKLPSGRCVSYTELGDPKGQPILMCHPIMGSRLIVPEDQEILRRLGIRLIIPDRPGFGRSTPATGKSNLSQWLEDMYSFIPLIGATGCSLLGYSSGGAYAMSLVKEHPHLIHKLFLVSSITPITHDHDLKGMLPITQMLIRLSRANKNVAHSVLQLALNKVAKNPTGYINYLLQNVPEFDCILIRQESLKHTLTKAFKEAIHQGFDAMSHEILFVTTEPFIKASDIQCPLTVWHGTDDKHAPARNMEKFLSNISHQVTQHWIPQAGHYMMFDKWPHILEGMVER